MAEQDDEPYTVPGRECGTCTSCCRDLAITQDGMNKMPGVTCEHCIASGGCAIYESRPNVCRDFHCAWRSLPYMDESWRPDRSGILINLDIRADGTDANLILVGEPEVLWSDRFAGMAAGFIESGTVTYLVVPEGVGFVSYHVRLNEVMAPAIARRDLATVKAIIRESYETIKEQIPVPIGPEHMGPGYLGGAVQSPAQAEA